jgi:hypothetical protein
MTRPGTAVTSPTAVTDPPAVTGPTAVTADATTVTDTTAPAGPSAGEWPELLAAALVGTERRPGPAADPAADLLDRVAGWAAYRRAGVQPGRRIEPPVPAPAESRPVIGEPAARRLVRLLDADSRQFDAASRAALMTEWLSLAVGRGFRVPPAQLPALLEYGRAHREHREAITAVGGARIRWLAEQNPDWTYLGAVADESAVDSELWTAGRPAQRAGYLRALRRREPDQARALLEADWATLTPDERGDLVATLAHGLGPADEPLLERALDDRRRDVREVAAGLLTVLPGAAYGVRMVHRAWAAVTPGPGGTLAVTPPPECDRSMRRDGITPKPPAGTGERAWWLEEVLARTPLSTWPPPADLLSRPVEDEWASTVHRGLARAAAARRDPVWAAALVPVLADTARDRECAAGLYPLLDPANLAAYATTALTEGGAPRWGPLLSNVPGPWPQVVAQAALAGIATLVGQPKLAGDLYQLCRLAAIRLPAALAPSARELTERLRAADPDNPRTNAVAAMAGLLSFRHEMNHEMNPEMVT